MRCVSISVALTSLVGEKGLNRHHRSDVDATPTVARARRITFSRRARAGRGTVATSHSRIALSVAAAERGAGAVGAAAELPNESYRTGTRKRRPRTARKRIRRAQTGSSSIRSSASLLPLTLTPPSNFPTAILGPGVPPIPVGWLVQLQISTSLLVLFRPTWVFGARFGLSLSAGGHALLTLCSRAPSGLDSRLCTVGRLGRARALLPHPSNRVVGVAARVARVVP